MGLPFMPVHGVHGTDYERVREDFLKVTDPYSGREIFVVPSITPDICLLHATLSDPFGNLVIPGSEANRLAALSARTTIASVERIVDEKDLAAKRGQTFLSALHVDLVVHRPLGAHPTSCPGTYPVDGDHVKLYVDQAKSEEKFHGYLATYVFGMSEEEYADRVAKVFFENALP